ncbi:MAG TPA: sigma-70 family RNA polymerase sigma factor [Saprospiraceae bacterium]|nr:sigma-70 family RNA polymerase sigma factor [Saprospiraceae bacterium]HMQ84667.1 sigma-70 family RNA polymerase sigma factor [Saprospiraceae bacterium]
MTTRDQTIVRTIREYGTRLFRFIRTRVSTDADAEDVLQDVWYQLSNLVDVETIDNINAWLFRVARNKVTDRYRKRKDEALEDYTYEDEEGEVAIRELLLADYHTPETEYLRQMIWETLFEALEELPPAQRDVFIWNELEDETFQSIAERTGENIKTLISRKRYAVQYLRERLQEMDREIG